MRLTHLTRGRCRLLCTSRTNRAGLLMSVDRSRPKSVWQTVKATRMTQFGNRGEYDISPCLLFWR